MEQSKASLCCSTGGRVGATCPNDLATKNSLGIYNIDYLGTLAAVKGREISGSK